MDKIDRFRSPYGFLSNFYILEKPIAVSDLFGGSLAAPTVEHAFIMLKSTRPQDRELIASCFSPARAKKLASPKSGKFEIRDNWDEIKLEVMKVLIGIKFSDENPNLKAALIATGDKEIIEGNYHYDIFWGKCLRTDVGENHLGRLLMERRAELTKEIKTDVD